MDVNRPIGDEGHSGRDYRVRSNATQDQGPPVSPGTPTQRTTAGGPVPVSRPEQPEVRSVQQGEDERRNAERKRDTDRKREAESEVARMLNLPGDTRLDITVDTKADEVRFVIRERSTGKLLREVPPNDQKPLLQKLREYSGTLVDLEF